jgi:hypothetical protein
MMTEHQRLILHLRVLIAIAAILAAGVGALLWETFFNVEV